MDTKALKTESELLTEISEKLTWLLCFVGFVIGLSFGVLIVFMFVR